MKRRLRTDDFRFYQVDDKNYARELGASAYKRGNRPLAYRWWRRHDDLMLLELARRSELRQSSIDQLLGEPGSA